jgi:hypothetical protein
MANSALMEREKSCASLQPSNMGATRKEACCSPLTSEVYRNGPEYARFRAISHRIVQERIDESLPPRGRDRVKTSKVDAHKGSFTQRPKGGKDAKKRLMQTGYCWDISYFCVFAPFASLRETVFR